MSMPDSRLDFRQTRFQMSAPTLRQCPPDEGAEIAFAGRSNAGKSSAINRLCEQPKLARTSKTPGRTQLINFFSVAENKRLVDLPGYGYAKVPQEIKRRWERNLTEYLNQRRCLQGCVLLMDIRHPMQVFDRNFIDWAVAGRLPVHLALTKADKLSRGKAKSQLLEITRYLKHTYPAEQQVSAQSLSALKGEGMSELQKRLALWLTTPLTNLM